MTRRPNALGVALVATLGWFAVAAIVVGLILTATP